MTICTIKAPAKAPRDKGLANFLLLILSSIALASCQAAGLAEQPESTEAPALTAIDSAGADIALTKAQRDGKTEVTVIGLIHSGHRTSSTFPLSRIEAVIREINPDIILTEIPPSRTAAALSSYQNTGRVTEQRTRAFPEYTDVVIPLQQELGYRIKGTAAWTPDIASTRRAALQRIQNTRSRAAEWRAWQAAQRQFRQTVNGRGSDPLYIHTEQYDRAVEARYQPYLDFFEQDIGKGGWKTINEAHWANIAMELDVITGQGKRVLVTYGGFHKYWFLRELEKRKDVILTPALPYFERNPG